MDNKKQKQFTLNSKSFKDEEKPSSESIQFHQQSPRFRNSKIQSPSQSAQSQTQYKDETQNSPCQSPRQKKIEINSQVILGSGGKATISRALPAEINEFNLFEYKGEKDFFNKMSAKLNEISNGGDVLVAKFLEKVYKSVLEEDFSLSSLQRAITRSKNNWKELLKVKNTASCSALIGNILPHFSRALARRSLANIQDLLKITLLYQYEYYTGMEKQLIQILDLFTKMLQIPQNSEENNTISNHVQRLVLLNIQSFCTPSISSKFQTEFQLIFKRIQELIMHFFNIITNQQGSSNTQPTQSSVSNSSNNESTSNGNYYSFLRFLATLLRTGHIVLVELKENKIFLADANNQKLTEKVFLRIFKFTFLGNPTFHLVIFGQNYKGILSNRLNNTIQTSDYSNGSRNSINNNSLMNNSFSASSQSEWSENDDMFGSNDKNKIEIIEGKVRNYTCLFVQAIIRQFPVVLKNQWQTLIKSNNITKDYLNSLKNHMSLEDKAHPSKKQQKEIEKGEEEEVKKDEMKVKDKQNNISEYSLLYPNYMEASLLSCLVFEDNIKIKSNVLQTLSALIENLPSKQLVSGLDVQKFEKSTSTFKPQSYLIYQSYKNIHFTLIHLLQTLCSKSVQDDQYLKNQILQLSPNSAQSNSMKQNIVNPQVSAEDLFINEQDEEIVQLCNQILKVYISLFNCTVQFEKMPFKDGIDLLLRQFILKVLRHVKTSEASLEVLHLKFNALQILNCVAKCTIRFDQFANRYLLSEFKQEIQGQEILQINPTSCNLFDLCMEEILSKIHSSDVNLGQESSQCLHDISLLQKEDALREMIALESITLLTNLQQNYFDCTLLYNPKQQQQIKYPIWSKVSEFITIFEENRNKSTTDKKRLLLLYDLIIVIAERRNSALQIVHQIQKKNLNKLTLTQSADKEKANNCQSEDNHEEEVAQNAEEEEEEENMGNNNQNNLILSNTIQQNPEFQIRIEEFEATIFSYYILNKVKFLIQQSTPDEQNKFNEEAEAPLMITSLNLSNHIRNDQWISNPEYFNFFKQKIFSLHIIPSVRFHILKTLGCIISCPVFNQDINNCKQILELLLREKQLIGQKKTSANLSVYSKLAQSIANWCYNVKDYSILANSSLSNLLHAIIDLASSPKDKISPHGLRALGIFLMKMTKSLYPSVCNPSKEDLILCKLLTENLTHKSQKVVWNTCVAIQNIFSNINCMLETNQIQQQCFFFSPNSISSLIRSLEHVLLSINNQKSQIYALKALQSIMNHPASILQSNKINNEIQQERIPHLFNVLTEIGSNIYSFHNSQNTNKSLGEQVVQFLVQLITKVHSMVDSNGILIEFIKDKYYQIISSFSQYIYQLWKNNKLDLHLALLQEESYQDVEKDIFNYKSKDLQKLATQQQEQNEIIPQQKEMNAQQVQENKQKDIYEEIIVKGQDEFKSVQFDFQHIRKSKILKEQLYQLKESSQILQQVIDQNDDLSVSLTIYDQIKEYASINLESSVLKFSIH